MSTHARSSLYNKRPVLSISEGSVFPDYLEVATDVVVSVWSKIGKTSPRASI